MMEHAEEATFFEIERLRRDPSSPPSPDRKVVSIKTTGDGIFAEFSSPTEPSIGALTLRRISWQPAISSATDGRELNLRRGRLLLELAQ